MVQWGTKTSRFWEDREEAGQALAEQLIKYGGEDTIVLALPRGGVVVAAEVAKALEAPLGLSIARKIGHPSNPEYAIAAVTEKGEPVINYTDKDDIDPKWFDAEVQKERKEAARRRKKYLAGRKAPNLTDKTVILVDDGVATSLTMKAVLGEVHKTAPRMIIVAVPVAPEDAAGEIASEADGFTCLHVEDEFFSSISSYYDRFEQVDDDEVISILDEVENVAGQPD